MQKITLGVCLAFTLLAGAQAGAGLLFADDAPAAQAEADARQSADKQTVVAGPAPQPPRQSSRMFGSQLFAGGFHASGGAGFNPDYQIGIGDQIALRLWGAFVFEGKLQVDPQGNIFIPNVGPVAVAGTRNGELNTLLGAKLRQVYKANVNLYAALDVAQPVKVFVTGFVKQPGLYGGIASDSVLSYLDQAGGVDAERGSYVDIAVKRGDTLRRQIDLYPFLLQGKMDLLQFADGDVIVVGAKRHSFAASGEVFNANDFEFTRDGISLQRALELARPKPGATHVSVVRRQGSQQRSEYYPLDRAGQVELQDGDQLVVSADRYAGTIQVRVEGAHSGEHAIVLPYGASMAEVLAQLKSNGMSQIGALQLFRKSVAERQKQMLELSLNKLQESSLSTRSATKEEAELRTREAELIGKFVAQARNVQPRGQVVLNAQTLASTLLEDGDVIRIPEKSSLVMVHGEVLFPNAVSWQSGKNVSDYIEQVGGYSQGSDSRKLVILRQNGEAVAASPRSTLLAGDEIMVLPKIESKNIEITRGISQIIYQIAVAAKVILDI
jgi:protein involved in polysaccharide export with SLBB domain